MLIDKLKKSKLYVEFNTWLLCESEYSEIPINDCTINDRLYLFLISEWIDEQYDIHYYIVKCNIGFYFVCDKISDDCRIYFNSDYEARYYLLNKLIDQLI